MPSVVCANCERRIGKLETPHIWNEQIVCSECYGRLAGVGSSAVPSDDAIPTAAEIDEELADHSPPTRQSNYYNNLPPPLEKSLGLTRKQCWIVIIVGLLTSAAIIGIPLILWGGLAEWNIVQERKRRKSG